MRHRHSLVFPDCGGATAEVVETDAHVRERASGESAVQQDVAVTQESSRTSSVEGCVCGGGGVTMNISAVLSSDSEEMSSPCRSSRET